MAKVFQPSNIFFSFFFSLLIRFILKWRSQLWDRSDLDIGSSHFEKG